MSKNEYPEHASTIGGAAAQSYGSQRIEWAEVQVQAERIIKKQRVKVIALGRSGRDAMNCLYGMEDLLKQLEGMF